MLPHDAEVPGFTLSIVAFRDIQQVGHTVTFDNMHFIFTEPGHTMKQVTKSDRTRDRDDVGTTALWLSRDDEAFI